MDRRYFLATLGVVAAGCSGTDTTTDSPRPGTATSTPAPSPSDTPTDTPPSTEPATETETEAEPPEDTESPTETHPPAQTFHGSGPHLTDRFTLEGGLVIVDATHIQGHEAFEVVLLTETGERVKQIADGVGDWEGSVVLHAEAGEYFIDIDADGDWQVNVRQPRPGSGSQLPQSMTETDSDYVGPIEASGPISVTYTAHDASEYGLWLVDRDGHRLERVFGGTGPTDNRSTETHASDIWFVAVETNGAWELQVELA